MIRRDPTEFGVIDASAHGHRVRPRRHQHRRRVRPAERSIHVAHQAVPRLPSQTQRVRRAERPIHFAHQRHLSVQRRHLGAGQTEGLSHGTESVVVNYAKATF